MIERAIAKRAKTLSEQFLTLILQGARQTGKTTLARMIFPDYNYVNLEDPRALMLAKSDVESFFSLYPSPLIIDEVQLYPELLRSIQVRVDAHQRMGEYILTGSHQPLLRETISESLAGRTAILDLYPLSLDELAAAGIHPTREEALYRGFMPRLYQQENLSPTLAHEAYYQTYVERDIRRLINLQHADAFHTFLMLLAGRVGQLINFTSLSNDIGVSATTLHQWLSILEASYIVFQLHPYHENLVRRLTKAPKIYFTDPGLAAYLLGITSADQIQRDPALGGLFENMVILEILKAQQNYGLRAQNYFYRDASKLEVDLLIKTPRSLHAIEIKAAMTPSTDFTKALERLPSILKTPISSRHVVYAGAPFAFHDIPYLPFAQASSICMPHPASF